MGVLEEAGLGRFEYGSDGQEQGPATHLVFCEGPANEHDKVDQPEEGYRKPLEDSKKRRTNPVRREMFFQRLMLFDLAARSRGQTYVKKIDFFRTVFGYPIISFPITFF